MAGAGAGAGAEIVNKGEAGALVGAEINNFGSATLHYTVLYKSSCFLQLL